MGPDSTHSISYQWVSVLHYFQRRDQNVIMERKHNITVFPASHKAFTVTVSVCRFSQWISCSENQSVSPWCVFVCVCVVAGWFTSVEQGCPFTALHGWLVLSCSPPEPLSIWEPVRRRRLPLGAARQTGCSEEIMTKCSTDGHVCRVWPWAQRVLVGLCGTEYSWRIERHKCLNYWEPQRLMSVRDCFICSVPLSFIFFIYMFVCLLTDFWSCVE